MLRNVLKILLGISVVGFLAGTIIIMSGNHNPPAAFVSTSGLKEFQHNYWNNFDMNIIRKGFRIYALSMLMAAVFGVALFFSYENDKGEKP